MGKINFKIVSKQELEEFKNLVGYECKCGLCFITDKNMKLCSEVHCNQIYYYFKCPNCGRDVEVIK